MHLLLTLVPLMLGSVGPLPDGGGAVFVGADGGEVPVVAPALTPKVAGTLAPELTPDGGVTADGGAVQVLAPRSLSVYQVNLPAEAAITTGFVGLYFMIDVLVKPTLSTTPSCVHLSAVGQCDPRDLSALDRYAVGRVSKPWSVFSDIALGTSVIVPVLYLGLESVALPTREPWGDFVNDTLVLAESLAMTAMLETMLKFTVRRPRPINYVEPESRAGIDTQLSLPSGHSAIVAAATTALSTTVFFRHPESKVRWVVLGVGIALSLATGWARVESGQHFPTDVITGLLFGGAAGFAVPYLHLRGSKVRPTVAFDPATGTSMLVFSGGL